MMGVSESLVGDSEVRARLRMDSMSVWESLLRVKVRQRERRADWTLNEGFLRM